MSIPEKYGTREENSNVHPFKSFKWLVHNS